MDRRTFAAILLSFAVYFGWMTYVRTNYPAPEPSEDGGITSVEAPAEAPAASTVSSADVAPAPSPAASTVPEREVTVEACGAELVVGSAGGALRRVALPDYQAPFSVQTLWRWLPSRLVGAADSPWLPYGEEPGIASLVADGGRLLALGTGSLDAPAPDARIEVPGPGHVVTHGRTASGIEVTRSLEAHPQGDACLMKIVATWRNASSSTSEEPLWLGLHAPMDADAGRYDSALRPYALTDGDLSDYWKIAKLEEPEAIEGPVDWLALADRYFGLVLLPEASSEARLWFSRVGAGPEAPAGLHYVVDRRLAPGEEHTETFEAYLGPKEMKVLKAIDPRLDELVPLGWFAFFGRILLWLLGVFHGLVANWGIAIMLLTFSVKLLFFPLTQASFKSSQAMATLQPELAKLREDFKGKPEEINRRTMELFQSRGVNPLGGCLPMLVQFPVWIALYQVLLNSVELYHTEFLYLKDLSAVDPYGLLPVIVAGLMVLQQRFTPMGNMDPAQARIMKLMPLMFGIFSFTFPAGLVLYIFVNMVLTIGQQWYIRRRFSNPPAAVAATS